MQADVDAGAARRLAVAADGGHRPAPLGAGQRVVHRDDQADEQAEHPRDAAGLVEIGDDQLAAATVIATARTHEAAESRAPTGSPRGGG